ncbi:MAG TPA: DUF1573 domain-containing protein [Ignavibacteria bacterium]|nr:DUF1573 domain-containing protein [Ignavibacteria bacterium]
MTNFLNSKGAKAGYFTLGVMAIITLMFFVISNGNLSAANKAPKVKFNQTSHDFGKVSQGPQLQYNFTFKNDGAGVLKIENISTSCGCTGATTGNKKEFAKGESGEIQVTFNTQGREGEQTKEILVYTNDPSKSQVMLKISCNIDPNM